MPPQKKSGERGSQRETPTSKKNNSFFEAYMSDIRTEGKLDDVHVSRVIRNMGNGRVEIFYVAKDGAHTENAHIRNLFRGKGKHSVNIDINSIVLVADSGISGPARFEIMCLLSPIQIRDLRKVVDLDPRLLNFEKTDQVELMKNTNDAMGGFEFEAEDENVSDDVDIDNI